MKYPWMILAAAIGSVWLTVTVSADTLVLRDGRAWSGHWSRPTANGGTTFTTASGQPMTFAPGQVWVVLTRR